MATSEPWMTLRFTRTLKIVQDPAKEAYVAEQKGTVAGFILLNLLGPLRGYIQVLAVMPEWRNRGIGKKLIVVAEERIFRASPNVFLCVSSFNTDAQRLYRRLGYQPVGKFKDYVVKGHSEILLRKTIGPIADFKPIR